MPPPSRFHHFSDFSKNLNFSIFAYNLDYDLFLASRGAGIKFSISKSFQKATQKPRSRKRHPPRPMFHDFSLILGPPRKSKKAPGPPGKKWRAPDGPRDPLWGPWGAFLEPLRWLQAALRATMGSSWRHFGVILATLG